MKTEASFSKRKLHFGDEGLDSGKNSFNQVAQALFQWRKPGERQIMVPGAGSTPLLAESGLVSVGCGCFWGFIEIFGSITALGIDEKDTQAMVKLVEDADFNKIPPDAASLRDWLNRAQCGLK